MTPNAAEWLSEAQTLALVGCSKIGCLDQHTNGKLNLCSSCNAMIIRIMHQALLDVPFPGSFIFGGTPPRERSGGHATLEPDVTADPVHRVRTRR